MGWNLIELMFEMFDGHNAATYALFICAAAADRNKYNKNVVFRACVGPRT